MSSTDEHGGVPVSSLMLKILGQIRDEAKQTNTRLEEGFERLDRRIEALDQRVDGLTLATANGFGEVNRRLDNLLLGPHRDDHRELRRRVARLEDRVGIDPLEPLPELP